MEAALHRAWLGRGPLAILLWPMSLVFGLLAAMRRMAYRWGLLHSTRLPVPVVVVGNVVAGGAGKTPVVIALVEHLKSRGLRAGVVSRGYGRQSDDCREVQAQDDAPRVGDEPLLIARSCRVPVVVARSRAQAALTLLRDHAQTQVIVCDDGLQHLALARDIEVCVFDDRGAGNGWLLPAGPLREPWPRPVDLVLHHGSPAGIAGHAMTRRLAQDAVRADGEHMSLQTLRGTPVQALAGIARPEAFFTMLRAAGLTLTRTIPLPDHHDFAHAPATDASPLLCTEKDAAKLWRHRPDAWAVPLQLDIPPAFWAAFDRLLEAKLSSAHGAETA